MRYSKLTEDQQAQVARMFAPELSLLPPEDYDYEVGSMGNVLSRRVASQVLYCFSCCVAQLHERRDGRLRCLNCGAASRE